MNDFLHILFTHTLYLLYIPTLLLKLFDTANVGRKVGQKTCPQRPATFQQKEGESQHIKQVGHFTCPQCPYSMFLKKEVI